MKMELRLQLNQSPLVECGNCSYVGRSFVALEDTPDLGQRLDPGDEVPAGECAHCGALVYLSEGE